MKKSKPRTNQVSFFFPSGFLRLGYVTPLRDGAWLEGYIHPNFPDARTDFGDLGPVSTRVGASMRPRCMRPALDVVKAK